MDDFRPLPSGRHGLTREQVHGSQRVRLLRGMAEVVAEHGYPDATVAQVLRRVHVSRQTFYQHFRDKQDCFLAVLDESARSLAAVLRAGAGTGLEQMLATYVARITEQAVFARVYFVESAAAGLPAQRKRIETQERFVGLMVETFRDTPRWRAHPDPEFACRILVGGVGALVTAALVEGDGPPADLPRRVAALADGVFGPEGT